MVEACVQMSDTLLTKRDAAEQLKVSVRTIDRLRAREELRFVTVGRQVRFRTADLDAFIAKQVQGA
jgi:excisionase family DNA binding protein